MEVVEADHLLLLPIENKCLDGAWLLLWATTTRTALRLASWLAFKKQRLVTYVRLSKISAFQIAPLLTSTSSCSSDNCLVAHADMYSEVPGDFIRKSS